MEIFRIIGVGMVGLFATVILKEVKPELAVVASVVTGIALLYFVIEPFSSAIGVFRSIADQANLDASLVGGVVKIIGVGYLTEFSASLCEDYGVSSVGKKMQFAGKILILTLSLPMITSIFRSIGALLG
ncbi:MAG TPA: hypothetical protein IAB14_03365 [Candidatus Stercoripulliclostridium merdipullorum]|uniref:Stage III sporulation protein AD n=1 Tax=Candidatus Stercoripulliclostridium merdipullorum TaxID=2840952 RepID=A0A9D1NCS9_9FIRM|nr:hypothetical protein [Candidatus Stercoripulliclostridium merdipullorum]